MKFLDDWELLSKSQKTMLAKAFVLSGLSTYPYRHGAVIVQNGNVIAVGVNAEVNPPHVFEEGEWVDTEGLTIHAEVAALNSCYKTDLRGATVYVARQLKNGCPSLSRPCPRCEKALRERGVKKVIYTTHKMLELIQE